MKIDHPGKGLVYRAIVKFTSTIGNIGQSKHAGKMREDILSYASEQGKKLAQERRKYIAEKPRSSEGKPFPETPDREIPIGAGGVALGGFLKNIGMPETPPEGSNHTKSWANTLTSKWSALLKHPRYNRHRKMRYNTVIGLPAGKEWDLLAMGHRPETYLQQIAERTCDLYVKARGWNETDKLGFYSGIHFDKEHVHIHLRIFPMSEQGNFMSVSNDISTNPEKQLRELWIACANQASEEWWRHEMPDQYQMPDVQLARLYNQPDPEILGIGFYLSYNSKQTKFSSEYALKKLDELVQCENMVKEYKASNPPVVTPPNEAKTLRRLSALKAYIDYQNEPDPPGIASVSGSENQKKKLKQGWLFAKTWKELLNDVSKLRDLLEWTKERKTKKDSEIEKKRKGKEGQLLKKLALKEIQGLIHEKVTGRKSEFQKSMMEEQIVQTLLQGKTIAQAIAEIEDTGKEEFQIQLLSLPTSEQEEITKGTAAGRNTAIELAKVVDKTINNGNNPNMDPQARRLAAHCMLEAAQAILEESGDKVPTHFNDLFILRAEQHLLSEESDVAIRIPLSPALEVESYQNYNLQNISEEKIDITPGLIERLPGLGHSPIIGPPIQNMHEINKLDSRTDPEKKNPER